MATTIKDVARRAGVSVATVSRALNGSSNITPQTRDRVLATVAEMRFAPSSAARSLVTRRTHTVGAVLPDLYGHYFSELIRGIDLQARDKGLHLLLSSSHGDAHGVAAALRAMHGRVDGVLVMSLRAEPVMSATELPPWLPAVLIGARIEGGSHDSFTLDNRGGALAMMRHLVERGHRRIAFVAGPVDNREARERLDGYNAGLAELLPEACALVLQGDFSEASGWRAGGGIAALEQRPSAVFACNDMMAIGCLSALGQAGMRVPQDVALAGFDDIPIARYVTPPLTTVRVRVAELGALALARLAAAIEAPGHIGPSHQTMRAELVVRQSCGHG